MPYIYLENGKKVKISEESYKALAKAVKENEILVPDDIKIENHCGGGDNLGIVFNNRSQVLTYDLVEKVWCVLPAYPEDFIKCKLVPVKREDLKVGYTYFRTESEFGTERFSNSLEDIGLYCKYLGNGRYVYVTYDGDVETNDTYWTHWYQVVPIEDE